jgi:hypothetical protein
VEAASSAVRTPKDVKKQSSGSSGSVSVSVSVAVAVAVVLFVSFVSSTRFSKAMLGLLPLSPSQ